MRRGLRRRGEVDPAAGADPGEPVADIEGVRHLALLAVADAVDAGGDLLPDDVAHRGGEAGVERGRVEPGSHLARLELGQQVGGRGRLPTWVVRMRSVLVFIGAASCGR